MPYNWDAPFEIRDIRNGEWYWVQKGVLASKEINASDKLVYSALAYFAHNKTQICHPSYDTISDLVDLHRNTVIKSVKALIKHKFISSKKREGKVNFYELLKLTSPKFRPVTKENLDQSKLRPTPVQKRTTNNTYLTRLNNNKGIESLKKTIQTLELK